MAKHPSERGDGESCPPGLVGMHLFHGEMNLFEQLVEMDRTEEKDEVLCRGTDRFKKAVGSGVG